MPFCFRPTGGRWRARIPERTVYICGTSKSLCAGLRVAFMAFPAAFRPYLAGGTYTINLKTVSLNAAIIAELIHSGLAEEIVAEKIRLAEERGAVYQRVFPESGRPAASFFKWLPLPRRDGRGRA